MALPVLFVNSLFIYYNLTQFTWLKYKKHRVSLLVSCDENKKKVPLLHSIT